MGYLLQRSGRLLLVYLILVAGVSYFAIRLPTAFVPKEDQGYFATIVQLPAGATQQRTEAVLRQMENYFLQQEPNVEDVVAVDATKSMRNDQQLPYPSSMGCCSLTHSLIL